MTDAGRIAREKDIERLRTMAMSLLREYERLVARLLELQKKVATVAELGLSSVTAGIAAATSAVVAAVSGPAVATVLLVVTAPGAASALSPSSPPRSSVGDHLTPRLIGEDRGGMIASLHRSPPPPSASSGIWPTLVPAA